MKTTHNRRVLYAGDTSINAAATYLASIMAYGGIEFDYVASDENADRLTADKSYALYVLSDYPASNLSSLSMQTIETAVHGGSGLLMIGGWESFRGSGGFYDGTKVAQILPVEVAREDDRVNWWGPCFVSVSSDHEIIAGLSFDTLPTVAGYNELTPRAGSTTVLSVHRYSAIRDGRSSKKQVPELRLVSEDPLLVVRDHGAGRTAAFASDFAPHWVGGLVDWGLPRVTATFPGSVEPVEVGSQYVKLVLGILRWCGRLG